jgi:hypothetical protein
VDANWLLRHRLDTGDCVYSGCAMIRYDLNGEFMKPSAYGEWVRFDDIAPQSERVALTDDEREQLEGITRCDPSWLLMHIKESTPFNVKVVEKVFELAKQQAAAILAASKEKP